MTQNRKAMDYLYDDFLKVDVKKVYLETIRNRSNGSEYNNECHFIDYR